MVIDVFGGLIRRVAIFAVADLAIVIDHLPERDWNRAVFFEVEPMEILSSYSDQPLEVVAVRQCPFTAALAAENSERVPCVVAEFLFPCDVLVSADGMVGGIAFPRADGVSRVDEVAPGPEQLVNRRQ